MAATMKDTILFDFGNTLVSYFGRSEWPTVLAEAIANVTACLRERGLLRVPADELAARVQAERSEPLDHRVRPLQGRLARIFDLSPGELADGLAEPLCRQFTEPIFARAWVYEDVAAALEELRRHGRRIGILSNAPWGSPAKLWHEEVGRHGLAGAVDAVVFCTEVGWRKPAAQPFEFIMARLGVSADRCLFVGDDPRWDLLGPERIGMAALLIDRTGGPHADQDTITSLTELLQRLKL